MKRRLLCLLCLLLFLLPTIPVYAKADLLVDEADILTDEEEQLLRQQAQLLSDTYDMDVAIVTVWSLNGEQADWFAQEYYIDALYGRGEDYDGILFLLSMQYRDWSIITCGDGVYVLTDYGIEQSFGVAAEYLANDDWYGGFHAWLTDLERYFASWEAGDPIDGYIGGYDGPGSYEPIEGDDHVYYDEPADGGDYLRIVFVSLLIGVIIAAITLGVMKGKMNTARKQRGATSYLKSGSYRLELHQDIFLYSNVTKTPRNTDSGGSGRGGGSTVRMGGGGRSFGGGRGKF